MTSDRHSEALLARGALPESREPAPACLLCGGPPEATKSLDSETIRRLWAVLDVNLSPAALETLPSGPVVLWRCQKCGFKYHDPRTAGNALFYAELEQRRKGYYPSVSWDFLRTIAFAKERGLRSVLDVGCGSGAFLDLAKAAGMETFGLDFNTHAVEECVRKGHAVFPATFSEFALRFPNKQCDLITAFQVLEHVPSPVQFLRDASLLADSGAYFSAAVPTEDGIYRLCPGEPHLWPPHHVSRWRKKDLAELGRLCDLKLIKLGAEALYGADILMFWELYNRLAHVLGRKPYPGKSILPRLISFVYRKTGARHYLPQWGKSVFAFYQK